MPHKKDTVTTAAQVATIVPQVGSMSSEGFNSTNVPYLAPQSTNINYSSQVQQQRLTEVNRSLTTTQQNINTFTTNTSSVNTYGLVRPSVSLIPKEENQMSQVDTATAELVVLKIWESVVRNELYYVYNVQTSDEKNGKCSPMTPQQRLQAVVDRATLHDYQMLMEVLKIPTLDQATDLAVLASFDVVVLMDDSSSMLGNGYQDFQGNRDTTDYDPSEKDQSGDPSKDRNNMTRWQHAMTLVTLVAFVLTMFDDDGISVRFLNKKKQLLGYRQDQSSKADNIKSAKDVAELFSGLQPSGGTTIGKSLENIYDELIDEPIRTKTLTKPVLILTYTDGQSSDVITKSVRNIRAKTRTTPYGSRCVLFSFNQVGRDSSAREMLGTLDVDPDSIVNGKKQNDGAGDITDCTSAYADEEKEYNDAQLSLPVESRVPYSAAHHNIKGLVGPIMDKYDLSDEGGQVQVQKQTTIPIATAVPITSGMANVLGW